MRGVVQPQELEQARVRRLALADGELVKADGQREVRRRLGDRQLGTLEPLEPPLETSLTSRG